jgi:dTDP-4-dehydrorhamnose reductase
MRIAVVGARGQLGVAMVHECAQRHEVTGLDRAALDIVDDGAVTTVMRRLRPDAIINCTGFNAVDAAESSPVQALQTNAFGVRALARAAREVGATLVHYSTDFVFDGTALVPMTEEVPPNPRSTYASSKLLGEWLAADAPVAYVLRVESLFGAGPGGTPKGSVESIVRGLRAGQAVRVFGDRTVSPTYIADAARATLALLERRSEPGLYHCVNSGLGTWLDVANEAARLLGVVPTLEVVSVHDVKLPAARPQFCALSNAKLQNAVGYEIPTWQDALGRYLEQRSA